MDQTEENTMRKLLIIAALVAAGIGAAASPAHADPITCPPGQEATANPSEGGWMCVNAGGHGNNSEDPRPPNADKGDFQP
jgi:opacity protein-like surface antigen